MRRDTRRTGSGLLHLLRVTNPVEVDSMRLPAGVQAAAPGFQDGRHRRCLFDGGQRTGEITRSVLAVPNRVDGLHEGVEAAVTVAALSGKTPASNTAHPLMYISALAPLVLYVA